MAVFSPDDFERLDWHLLRDGPVVLYFRRDVLDGDLARLQEHGYDAKMFDCLTWVDERAMHADFARTLSFPDYYGHNLDALNDCLSDVEITPEGGLALVFSRFDAFAAHDNEVAQHVLDIIAGRARQFLLFGRRALALVQSDDPRLEFRPVGATAVGWNGAEWLNERRGV